MTSTTATTAITRQVSPAMNACELTHQSRQPIDVERARAQHRAYEQLLVRLGCDVVSLPASPELPDSVFVEDAALAFPELGVVTRPGAASRRAEIAAVAGALEAYRALRWIEAPATLDGGDVLRIHRTVFVGRSSRTNATGAEQLRACLEPYGYSVTPVAFTDCLHLKSAVTQVSDDAVLLNPAWVDARVFDRWRRIEIDPEEACAANALRIGDAVLYPAAFARTAERLVAAGLRVVTTDVSELAKAEGAVTCCSILIEA